MRRNPNVVLSIENGVAVVDVSTKRHPQAVTMVDEADLPIITQSSRRWSVSERGRYLYVSRSVGRKGKTELLHRIILGLTDNAIQGDHIYHDTLDNRRSKLRKANHSQNASNRRSCRNVTSPYLGVDKHSDGAWRARFRRHRKAVHIGSFRTEIEAAQAYDDAVRHDPFANLNFSEGARA